MFSALKIVYLTTLCLVLCINFSVEHIGISPLTFKKVKPSVESSIRDHLLFCSHDPSFDDFTILAQGTNKFLLEIKGSLLIKRDKPIWNKNISSAPLFLFDKVWFGWIIPIIINLFYYFLSRCFYLDKRVLFCGFTEKNDCLKTGAAALETLQKI